MAYGGGGSIQVHYFSTGEPPLSGSSLAAPLEEQFFEGDYLMGVRYNHTTSIMVSL